MTQVMYVIHLASRIITANASNFKYWMLCELVHTEPKRGETPSRKTKRGAHRRHFSGRGPLLLPGVLRLGAERSFEEMRERHRVHV